MILWWGRGLALRNQLRHSLLVTNVLIDLSACFRIDAVELFLNLPLLLKKCFVAMVQAILYNTVNSCHSVRMQCSHVKHMVSTQAGEYILQPSFVAGLAAIVRLCCEREFDNGAWEVGEVAVKGTVRRRRQAAFEACDCS